jgi:hypothetical protein
MPRGTEARLDLPPRLRRTLELVYGVEGVVGARVWQWRGVIAVGVRGASATAPTALLSRVESAIAGLREPGETWEFGILEEGANLSTSSPGNTRVD